MIGEPTTLLGRVARRRLAIVTLIAMCLLYFFSYFQRIAVPGHVFNEIQSTFAASAAAVTTLGAIYLYIYAAMQVIVGALADRFGATRTLLAGGLLLAIGSICFPLSPSLGALYASRALVGLGASFMFLSIVREIDPLFGARNFASVLGFVLFTGYCGGFAGTAPLEWAVATWGWRSAMLAAGVACAAALVLVAWLLRKTHATPAASEGFSLKVLGQLCKSRQVVLVLVCGAINFASYLLMQATMGVKVLQDCCHMPALSASGATSMMMTVVMFTAFGSGFISRLAGNRRRPFLLFSTTLTVVALALLLGGLWRGAPAWWFMMCYVMLAVSTGFSAMFTATLKELSPPGSVAFALGFGNGVTYLLTALYNNLAGGALGLYESVSPFVDGVRLYPIAAYQTLAATMLGLAVLSLGLSLFIRETGTLTQPRPG